MQNFGVRSVFRHEPDLYEEGVESGTEVFSLIRSSELGPEDCLTTFFSSGQELEQSSTE